jgi:hypothetical protein
MCHITANDNKQDKAYRQERKGVPQTIVCVSVAIFHKTLYVVIQAYYSDTNISHSHSSIASAIVGS